MYGFGMPNDTVTAIDRPVRRCVRAAGEPVGTSQQAVEVPVGRTEEAGAGTVCGES